MDSAPLPLADPQQLHGLLDALPDAFIVADAGNVIRWWNPAAQRLFGFAREEALGASLDLLVPERFRAAHNAGLARAVSTGEMRTGGRVLRTRSQHKDGRKLYVDFTFGLWKDAAGAVLGVCALARDATEQHLQKDPP